MRLYLTLGAHIGTVRGTGRPTLPYPTLPPSPLREEPYAGGRADLLGSPISAGYWAKTITTALGGAPLELWYWVSSSLCETFLCRVIQVQIDLLFGLNSHDFRNEIFF